MIEALIDEQDAQSEENIQHKLIAFICYVSFQDLIDHDILTQKDYLTQIRL